MDVQLWPTVCTCGQFIADKGVTYINLVKGGLTPSDAMNQVGAVRICCRSRILNPSTYLVQEAQPGGIPPTPFDKTRAILTYPIDGANIVKIGIEESTKGINFDPADHIVIKESDIKDDTQIDYSGAKRNETYRATVATHLKRAAALEKQARVKRMKTEGKFDEVALLDNDGEEVAEDDSKMPAELKGIKEPKTLTDETIDDLEPGDTAVVGYLRDEYGIPKMTNVGDGYRVPWLVWTQKF